MSTIAGQRFARLTAVEFSHRAPGGVFWKCVCDCGGMAITTEAKLRSGHTKSCGCYKRERTIEMVKRRARMWAVNEGSLTKQDIERLFIVDIDRGALFHRNSRGGSRAGARAGYIARHGYRTISINGKRFLEHRLVWFFLKGEWPAEIDHIDRDRQNNAPANLRVATRSQNNGNHPCRCDSQTGVKGVSPVYKGRTFAARIRKDGGSRLIGCFPTIQEAKAAYDAEARRLFGEFARSA